MLSQGLSFILILLSINISLVSGKGGLYLQNKSPPSSHKAQVQSPRLIIGTDPVPPRVAETVVREGEVLAEFLGKIIQCLRSWFDPFMMNDDIGEINNNNNSFW